MLIISESFAGCRAACDICWTEVVETEPFIGLVETFVAVEADTIAFDPDPLPGI